MDMIDTDKSGMIRDPSTEDEGSNSLVKSWNDRVVAAKKHWKPDFDRMKRNMEFTSGKQWPEQGHNMEFTSGKQWPGQGHNDDRYVANFTQRVVKTLVSALYAKNPQVAARRRKRLDYAIWDGKPESMAMAMQAMQPPVDPVTGAPVAGAEGFMPDPNAILLMQDIVENGQRVQMLEKVGKTLEVLIEYFMSEQTPRFKTQMKQMIRRARTTGVGYIELGFERQMDLSDDQAKKIADMSERLATIGQLAADLQDGEIEPDSAEAAQLEMMIAAIEAEPEMIVREGLAFGFPQSTRIIPAPETQELVGWVGSPWIAKEVLLTVDRVKQVYNVDLGKNYTGYKEEAGKPWGSSNARFKDKGKGLACIWHIYCRDSGLEYIVADGYANFLRPPAAPDVQVEQFFPIWALTFNEVENEEELFPRSDVELIKHIQKEYNRNKEALRQHRIANRPLYLTQDGQFDEGEEESLSNHAPHAVIKIKHALKDGQKPGDMIAPVQKVGVDPNLYESESLFNDLTRVVGTQQAQIGGTAGGTATESTIAAQSQAGSIGLDSDDLDEMLSDVMRSAGQVLLTHMSTEQVMAIAGPGAAWPEMSRLEVMAEIGLEIKAGSSGRPQAAEEAATFERLYPLLVQLPGINPRWLAERAIRIADDAISLEDAYIDGLPSIMAQNKAAQAPTGNPATEPSEQGEEGEDKNERAGPAGPTAQPGFNTGAQPNQM